MSRVPAHARFADLPPFPFRTSCVSNSTSVRMTRLVPIERNSACFVIFALEQLETTGENCRKYNRFKQTTPAPIVSKQIKHAACHVRRSFGGVFTNFILPRSFCRPRMARINAKQTVRLAKIRADWRIKIQRVLRCGL
jgi:hypothetical protein